MIPKLTEVDRAQARFALAYAELWPIWMTVRQQRIFAHIGDQREPTVGDVARSLKEASGTTSRTLLDIGPRDRWGRPGALLIDSYEGVRGARHQFVTEAGIDLLHKIAKLRQTGG